MSSHGNVEDFQAFDVHVLHRVGALQEALVTFPWVSFRWPGLVHLRANKWRVDIEFRHGATQRIPVVWTSCHFGGWRPWFMCGRCSQRVGKLYSTGVALHCRRCLSLWYSSQRRGAKSRRYLRALKLRLRLGGVAHLREPFRPDQSACTERPMPVCVVSASGLSKTSAIIPAFETGKRITGLWCPNDLGMPCLSPVRNATKVIFIVLR